MSDPVEATDWRQLAADATISEGMFIGGERRAAIDGSTRPVNFGAGWLDAGQSRVGTTRRRRCGRGRSPYGI